MPLHRQGFTFDTGMLIALERRHQRALQVRREARLTGTPVTVPAAVIGEWWRGRTDVRDDILASVHVEPLVEGIAKLAGLACARLRDVDATRTIDAYVMASAALRGDVVFTSDVRDLTRFQAFFPGVRVLSIGQR
jgi:predicted nucleic acid-binding protein